MSDEISEAGVDRERSSAGDTTVVAMGGVCSRDDRVFDCAPIGALRWRNSSDGSEDCGCNDGRANPRRVYHAGNQ